MVFVGRSDKSMWLKVIEIVSILNWISCSGTVVWATSPPNSKYSILKLLWLPVSLGTGPIDLSKAPPRAANTVWGYRSNKIIDDIACRASRIWCKTSLISVRLYYSPIEKVYKLQSVRLESVGELKEWVCSTNEFNSGMPTLNLLGRNDPQKYLYMKERNQSNKISSDITPNTCKEG